jgi:GNAT superfamily N-acetyltransferase
MPEQENAYKKITTSYTKVYENTNHPDGNITFSLDIRRTIHVDRESNEVIDFKMEICPRVIKAPQELSSVDTAHREVWELHLSKMKVYEPFRSSLFLHKKLQRLGIGKVILNLLIEEGKLFFPNHGAHLRLGPELTNEKIEVKERFYKRFGFDIKYKDKKTGDGSAAIEAFSQLNTLQSLPEGITEIEVTKKLKELQSSLDSTKEDLSEKKIVSENLLRSLRNCEDELYKIKGTIFRISVRTSLLAIIGIAIYLMYIKYFT